jgi:hypothetical protein
VIRRSALIFVEFLAGLAAGAMILMLVAWWLLSSGPITLTFLNPYIEEALSPRDSTIAVEIDNTVLVWAGWDRAIDMRVSNLRVLDLDRQVVAVLPQVSLGFSLRAMLRGLVAPTYLDIIGSSVSVIRSKDGRFVASVANEQENRTPGKPDTHEDIILKGLVTELLSEPDPTQPLGYLRRVGIVDAELRLEDHLLGRVWHAPRADIAIIRNTAGISANLALDLRQDGHDSRITGVAELRAKTGAVVATLNFAEIELTPFLATVNAPAVQRIAASMNRTAGKLTLNARDDGTVRSVNFDVISAAGHFSGDVALDEDATAFGARLRFDSLPWAVVADAVPEIGSRMAGAFDTAGTLEFAGTMDGYIDSATFDIATGAGSIRVPPLFPEPLELAGIRIRGDAGDNGSRIGIAEAVIDLPRGSVAMDAAATRVGEEWSVRYAAHARGIPADDVEKYWPKAAAQSARKWVLLNLRKGIVTDSSLSMVAKFTQGQEPSFSVVSLHGNLAVEGLEVNYLHPMPRVTDGRADMTFTADRFDIAVHGAKLRDMSVDSGTVIISDVSGYNPKIDIDVTLRGPLQTALGVLDSEPLGFLGNLGIPPEKITGAAAARLVFQFPLLNSLRVDQVAVAAGATLRNVAIADGPMGLSMQNGSLELKVTGQGLTTTGNAQLNGVPVNVDWRENFGRVGSFQRQIKISGRIGNEERKALNIPAFRFLDGPARTEVVFTVAKDQRREISVQADLRRTSLDFPFVYWRKPPGVPGSLSAFAVVGADGKAVIEELKIATGDLQANARAELAPGTMDLKLLEFRDLRFAGNHLMGRIGFRDGGGYDVVLAGERLDVTPFLEPDDEVDSTLADGAVPIRIEANMDEVVLAEGRILHGVRAVLDGDGIGWRQVDVQAAVEGGAGLSVRYAPQGEGSGLLIETENAGDALRALGWTKRVSGGSLRIAGTKAQHDAPMVGKFSLQDFKVSDAPALAKILQVLSLTGIFSAFNQNGLDFVRLDGDFRYFGGVVEVKDTRAFGSSIGITTEGAIVTGSNLVKLNGTVVPAYTINQVLGKIPLLGQILTGGKNEGVFAANYVLNGSLENPQVSVNPLSALAPGFLRNLVGGEVKPLDPKDVPLNTQ